MLGLTTENRMGAQGKISSQLLPKPVDAKIYGSLVDYVYGQIAAGLFSTVFCASVILIGLFQTEHKKILYAWYITLVLISVIRLILARIYHSRELTEHDQRFWGISFIVFAALSGICWGFVGTVLLPNTAELPQILIILMLGGITAGSVPLFSGLLWAAIIFLTVTILPVTVHLVLLGHKEYLLLASTLALYLIYLIVLSVQFHRLIIQVIYFKFKNDELLQQLLVAKSRLEVSNKQLEHSATHDPLTEVPNRNLFTIKLRDAIKRAARKNKMLGVFYIDLDRFKLVNDTYGHEVGDKLLIQVVNRIKNAIRRDDIIARVGGDEFTIILENLEDIDDLGVVAIKIGSAFTKPLLIDKIALKITVTIGISIYPNDGEDPESLTKAADAAMYHTKLTQPGTYSFFYDVDREKGRH